MLGPYAKTLVTGLTWLLATLYIKAGGSGELAQAVEVWQPLVAGAVNMAAVYLFTNGKLEKPIPTPEEE